jgi:hypothetical protein
VARCTQGCLNFLPWLVSINVGCLVLARRIAGSRAVADSFTKIGRDLARWSRAALFSLTGARPVFDALHAYCVCPGRLRDMLRGFVDLGEPACSLIDPRSCFGAGRQARISCLRMHSESSLNCAEILEVHYDTWRIAGKCLSPRAGGIVAPALDACMLAHKLLWEWIRAVAVRRVPILNFFGADQE